MKNYLIITLGTRDVQLRKDLIEQSSEWEIVKILNTKTGREDISIKHLQKDYTLRVFANDDFPNYFTVSPRLGGKVICDGKLPDFKSIIEFPLIMPVIDFFEKESKQIHNYLLIYTDQEQEFKLEKIKSSHYNNDTLYFKDIVADGLKKLPLLSQAQYDEYGIFEQVANIDFQYEHFATSCKDLLLDQPENIGEILLLPQGGIDQINHAVTLQLLQAFKHKVRLYQKPEAREPIELKFNQKFLNDLNKQKIIKHLEDYDFDKASLLMLDDMSIKSKLDTATKRLNMTYQSLFIEEHHKMWEELSVIEQNRIKIQDITYNFKIQMRQAKYNDALTKLYTIYENLFKQIVCEFTNIDTGIFYNRKIVQGQSNANWEDFINGLDTNYLPKLQAKKIGNTPLDLRNPNVFTYFYLLRFLVQDKKLNYGEKAIKKIDTVLQKLRDKRNAINHTMGAVLKSEIDDIFANQKITELEFYDLLDEFAKTKGMGYYEQLRQECLKFYL